MTSCESNGVNMAEKNSAKAPRARRRGVTHSGQQSECREIAAANDGQEPRKKQPLLRMSRVSVHEATLRIGIMSQDRDEFVVAVAKLK
jgi:hypothetical protein